MNNIVISVIVPVYNVEKYLNKCIDSILNQTFIKFEVLLIDDGSTDNSGKICDEYAQKDSRIKVFHIKNQGVSNARNVGLDNANGEYIAFVDSDDWVEKDYLLSMYNAMKEKNAEIVFCKKNLVYNNEVFPSKEEYLVSQTLENYDDFYSKFFILNANSDQIIMGAIWRSLFRMKIIKLHNIRFNVKLKYCEDMCFLFEYISHVKSVEVVNKYLYNYVQTGESFTTKHKDMFEHYNIFYDNIIKYINSEFLNQQIAFQMIYFLFKSEIEANHQYNKKNLTRIYKNEMYKSFNLRVLLKSKNKSKRFILYLVFTHLRLNIVIKKLMEEI